MADTKISALNSLTKSTVATNDVLPIVDTGSTETKKITYQELIQPTDANFRIAGSSDTTKLVAFEVDGLTTATTRTLTVPDADMTLVGLATTQTLTNKTLTSPQINFGSDANGDLIYRNGSGVTARLPIGSTDQILTVVGGVPAWQANAAASDSSTTVKGVVELATLAETLARTTTGGTSAKLVVTPDNLTTVQTYDYAADAVGTDAYAITVTPAPTAYVTGQTFTFKAGTANTGACTLNVNSLGAKTIKKNYNSDLATGDILANQIVQVTYDGTNMQLVSPSSQPALFAQGQTSRAAASGDGDITIAHGLGVTPKLVKVTAMASGGSNQISNNSFGTATSTSNETCTYSSNSGASFSVAQDSSNIIHCQSGSGTELWTATLSTLDSTNIVLTADITGGAGTLYIQWEAYA